MSNGDEHEIVEAPEGWRVAITAFDEAQFTFGSRIPKSWFWEAFELQEPKEQTSYRQAKEGNLRFLGCFKAFEEYLLNERSMALKVIWSQGYEIVTPEEQTAWAEVEFEREMKKAFSRAAERLINIDHSRLTSQQSRKNADALARVGGLRALTVGRNRLTAAHLKKLTLKERDDEKD